MAENKRRLDGKVAIITGGASGIGEETTRRFIKQGAIVVIADVQDEKGQDLASSLDPKSCTYMHCDVTSEEQVITLVKSTTDLHGRLDIMFSNAGMGSKSKQDILEFDILGLDNLFAVNVRGAVLCVKHAARAMIEHNIKGSIICTASIAAKLGADRHIDYIMSKHAVLGLVRSASKQLGENGIRVNCVSPGAVGTPLLCGLYGMGKEEVERLFEPASCLEGVLEAKHVADAVVFLASDEAGFVNGHDLVVDGGSRYG